MKCPLCGTLGAYQSFNMVECSKQGCKNHVGPAATDHDWQGLPIYDLTSRFLCRKCQKSERMSLMDILTSGSNVPAPGICPGVPPEKPLTLVCP